MSKNAFCPCVQKSLAATSTRASFSQIDVAWLRTLPPSGWRTGSRLTSWQTSVSWVPVRFLISLCRIVGKAPRGQLRAWSMVKFVYCVADLAYTHAYLNCLMFMFIFCLYDISLIGILFVFVCVLHSETILSNTHPHSHIQDTPRLASLHPYKAMYHMYICTCHKRPCSEFYCQATLMDGITISLCAHMYVRTAATFTCARTHTHTHTHTLTYICT